MPHTRQCPVTMSELSPLEEDHATSQQIAVLNVSRSRGSAKEPPAPRPSRNLSSKGEHRGMKSDAESSDTVPCPVSAPVRTRDGDQDTLRVSAHLITGL